MAGDHFDFFISYASTDRAWAEWVAWQLTDAGYTVELDVWDWPTGQNFITAISKALERCDRVLALFSTAYFDPSRYTTDEWTTAMLHGPGAAEGKLVPVRVEAVPVTKMPAILRPLVYRDLFEKTEEQARKVLLDVVAGPRHPDDKPVFPAQGKPGSLSRLGGAGPRLPGTMPRIWNIPARNPWFTGRDELLLQLREVLTSGARAVVQALEGMGGVGKTQLAVEYAHRFAGSYDFAWWVDCEHGNQIGADFAALGVALQCVDAETEMEVIRTTALAELRERGRWLLVFDSAADPGEIARWLPGSGHVLITSRERVWAEIATPVEVDVLARPESVAILQRRVPRLSTSDADLVAGALGDFPLALAQAANHMATTGMPAAEYVELLDSRAENLLSQGQPKLYPQTLAAVTQVAFTRLRDEDPAAAELATMCALLAPELIPTSWFTRAAAELPAALAAKAADTVAWREVLARLGRNSLARIDQNGIQMHRVTQAILRSLPSPDLTAAMRTRVEAVLAANNPGDPVTPENWPVWAQLVPHLLSADPAASSNSSLRDLACEAAEYLIRRGDIRIGYDLASRLHQQWHDLFGPDDRQTLWAAGLVAWGARAIGRHRQAQELDQDILDRRRGTLGDDDIGALDAATNLADDLRNLGDNQAARELDEDTLARKQRVLGEDHPSTLTSANSLANTLRALGETQAARRLYEDTLTRRRRVLGQDHPRTLDSAHNFAICLYDLGDYRAARDLDQDTLDRRRSVLGTEHPSTLASANRLAVDLHEVGDLGAARILYHDTLNRCRRILGDDDPDTVRVTNNFGIALRELGDPAAARNMHQDTLDRYRRILGADHTSTLSAAINLAADLRELGETEAARDLAQDTLDRCRRVLGENHPSTLLSADNLAADLYTLGDLETAKDMHQDTLDRRRQTLGEDHSQTLRTASNLAVDLRALGEAQAARDLDQDTLDRCRRILGADHPTTLCSANNLAGDLDALGDREAARDLLQDTVDRYRRTLGQDHPDTLRAASNLAEILHKQGTLQAALDLYQDTLDRYQRTLGEDHPDTRDVAGSLGEVWLELGETR